MELSTKILPPVALGRHHGQGLWGGGLNGRLRAHRAAAVGPLHQEQAAAVSWRRSELDAKPIVKIGLPVVRGQHHGPGLRDGGLDGLDGRIQARRAAAVGPVSHGQVASSPPPDSRRAGELGAKTIPKIALLKGLDGRIQARQAAAAGPACQGPPASSPSPESWRGGKLGGKSSSKIGLSVVRGQHHGPGLRGGSLKGLNGRIQACRAAAVCQGQACRKHVF